MGIWRVGFVVPPKNFPVEIANQKKDPTVVLRDDIEVFEKNKQEHTDEELHLEPTPLNQVDRTQPDFVPYIEEGV